LANKKCKYQTGIWCEFADLPLDKMTPTICYHQPKRAEKTIIKNDDYNLALDDAKGAVENYRKSRYGYPNEAPFVRNIFQNINAAIEGLRRKG